jgi:hypothetical protein
MCIRKLLQGIDCDWRGKQTEDSSAERQVVVVKMIIPLFFFVKTVFMQKVLRPLQSAQKDAHLMLGVWCKLFSL